MPDNSFNKEEKVAFEAMLEGFEDAEIMSHNVSNFKTDQAMMERTENTTMWRPVPYIMASYDGEDQTGNFKEKTQLSVPARISIKKSVPWVMSALELRDALQNDRLGIAAQQRLSSDVNIAILNKACISGTLVVPIKGPATGYANIAEIETIMNAQGIHGKNKVLALCTEDYNSIAADLARRDTVAGKTQKAMEESYIGKIASLNAYKLDYSMTLDTAAGGAISVDTSALFYTPKATTTNPTTEERLNVDNRTTTIAVTGSTGLTAAGVQNGVKTGDCFTIPEVYAVHHITKQNTRKLKTFRVVDVPTTNTLEISPPIVDPSRGGTIDTTTNAGKAGADQSELAYQNVVVKNPASGKILDWLNTADASVNPFWMKEAMEILPGRYMVPSDAGVGVLRGTTSTGIEITFTKQYDINNMRTKYRVDTIFGVSNLAPEQTGILLFNQV